MAYIYILKDENKKIYIGSCLSIKDRFHDHSRGNTKSTRYFMNPRVCWLKEVNDLKIARAIEKKIKKWKSRKMVELLINGTIQV